IIFDNPVCDKWLEHSPQLAGHEHTSMGTLAACVPFPSVQYLENLEYIAYDPKYSSSVSPCSGHVFVMKTLLSRSNTSAGKILLQSGQIDCVCRMKFPFVTCFPTSRLISATWAIFLISHAWRAPHISVLTFLR